MQNSDFGAELQVSMGPTHDLPFCACKPAWLASESLVSMCPSPHLWFLHAKQRILDQNFKSLWVPALICGFCMQSSAFLIRITNLYGSHISPILLCMQNSVICTRITSLYGSQPSSVVFACKIAALGLDNKSLLVPDLTCRFVHAKQSDLHQNDKFTWVPALICSFVQGKQRA